MTEHERTISRKLDAVVVRLECEASPLVRWWLRAQKRWLERGIRKEHQG